MAKPEKCWGGDPGYSWAKKVVKQMESANKIKEAAQRVAYMFIQAQDTIPGGLVDKNNPREIAEYRIYDKQTKQQVGGSYPPPKSEYHKNRARTQAEKMNQQHGSIRYIVKPIFSDDPSLQQKTAVEFTSIEPTLNPNRFMTVRELARAIRLAITAEHDAVHLYELIADSTPDAAVRKIMQDVANEEKEHVGEFEELLARIDPENEHLVGKGVQEAEELIQEKLAKIKEEKDD